jgi:hypothetical protein
MKDAPSLELKITTPANGQEDVNFILLACQDYRVAKSGAGVVKRLTD